MEAGSFFSLDCVRTWLTARTNCGIRSCKYCFASGVMGCMGERYS